jgi:pyruvate kinase
MNRRKIVATIGPATDSTEALRRLVEAGMDVARLNGSHADTAWHARTIARLRAVDPSIPILLDIPGRKIRTVQLAHEPSFAAGDIVVLTTDQTHDGSAKVPVNYLDLHRDVSEGDTIFADDGQLRFTVQTVSELDIICRSEVAGTLRSAKGINAPSVTLQTALVTERDREMLAFAGTHDVDFVGISFVESASHIGAVRDVISAARPAVVAKIENQGAMAHLHDIVASADAVMIDRGDLSVETALESVVLFQKQILAAARQAACPAIVATEILHSMIGASVPTKAEVSDITNAVLDGASALMLSGETAIGAFPFESVATMRRIVDCAVSFEEGSRRAVEPVSATPAAVSAAVGLLCERAPITKIVAVTISGFAARMIAAQFPRQRIIAVSNNEANARSFNLLAGVTGVCVNVPFSPDSTDHIAGSLEALWHRRYLNDEDLVLVVSVAYPKSGNRMNFMQMHRIADLCESLSWTR